MRATTTTRAALVLVVALVAVSSTAAAGAPGGSAQVDPGGNNSSTSTPTAPTGEQIEPGLVLLDSEWIPKEGTVSVTLRSDEPTSVTLTDASGWVDGGVVNTRTVVIEEGTTTVEIDGTRKRGIVAVTIGTQDTLYAEVVRREPLLPFPSAPGGPNDLLALVAGAALGPGIAVTWSKITDADAAQTIRRVD